MFLIQRQRMKDFPNFEELLAERWNYIRCVCKFNKLHIVFAGYISSSLKECERERKSNCETLRLDSLFPSTEGPS